MRNLMIGAVSAVLLMSAPAIAQQYDTKVGPDGVVHTTPGATSTPESGKITNGPLNAPGVSGSTMDGRTGSGSSMPGTTVENGGMGSYTSSNPARDNQTATGTHCPPGTPNCGPTGQ